MDISWIENKKAYDILPQTWIIEFLKMYRKFDKLINSINEDIKSWKIEFATGVKTFEEVKSQRDIIQREGHTLC